MIFVLDVGNTNIKCGLFENGMLMHSWRISAREEQTSDELGIKISAFFNHLNIDMNRVEGIMISSVIPSINYTMEHMCRLYFDKLPMFVEPGIKTGMNIFYDNPKDLGPDRIVNAVAAYEIYGGPCITVDFGTATTFGAISKKGDFLGGTICPGIKISSEALTINAAKLPRVDLSKPKNVINRNTIGCMQAGIIYGYVGLVDYIVRKMKMELEGDPKVVATGGMANLIVSETEMIDEVNSVLTLKGLYYLYERNK